MVANTVNLNEAEKEIKQSILKILTMPLTDNGYEIIKAEITKLQGSGKCAEGFVLLSIYANAVNKEENRVVELFEEALKKKDVDVLKCFESAAEGFNNVYIYKNHRKLTEQREDNEEENIVDYSVIPLEDIDMIISEYMGKISEIEITDILSTIQGYIWDITLGNACAQRSTECSLQRIEAITRKTLENTKEIKNIIGNGHINFNEKAVPVDNSRSPAPKKIIADNSQPVKNLNEQQNTKVDFKPIEDLILKEVEEVKKTFGEELKRLEENLNKNLSSESPAQQPAPQQGAGNNDILGQQVVALSKNVTEILSGFKLMSEKIENIESTLNEFKSAFENYIQEEKEYLEKLQENKG